MTAGIVANVGERLPHRLFVGAFSLLTAALLFDLVDVSTGTGALALLAYWLGAAGVIGGTAAGLCRFWRLVPSGVAASPWRLTALPGFFKAAGIALFAGGWSLRTLEGNVPAAALVLAAVGAGVVAASAWLPAGPQATLPEAGADGEAGAGLAPLGPAPGQPATDAF
jgi:uncharacterized membrane protein